MSSPVLSYLHHHWYAKTVWVNATTRLTLTIPQHTRAYATSSRKVTQKTYPYNRWLFENLKMHCRFVLCMSVPRVAIKHTKTMHLVLCSSWKVVNHSTVHHHMLAIFDCTKRDEEVCSMQQASSNWQNWVFCASTTDARLFLARTQC